MATKELGLELVGQANGGLVGHEVFLFLGLRLWSPGHSVACASTAGVIVSAVLARSNSNFRDDVLILAVGGWCAYISDVSSAYVWEFVSSLRLSCEESKTWMANANAQRLKAKGLSVYVGYCDGTTLRKELRYQHLLTSSTRTVCAVAMASYNTSTDDLAIDVLSIIVLEVARAAAAVRNLS